MLLASNQPRAAENILQRLDPQRDLGWWRSPEEAWNRYWLRLAGSQHAVGEYSIELGITDRWRDSASWEWKVTRGRALSALGREREVRELLASMAGSSADLDAGYLRVATELAAHGHLPTAKALAESLLAQLDFEPGGDWNRASNIAWANRLLGWTDRERRALEWIVQSDADTLTKLEAHGRIAVLLADSARARRIDSSLAELSDRPLSSPWPRASQILARAHIAAGLGRRDLAVRLLQEAKARGLLDLGASYAYHADLLLAPLRGFPPFDALLQPDN